MIYNGVDLQGFYPDEPYPRLLHQWDLEDRFVCSYVGTIGMAHGLEVVLEAARVLKNEGRHDVAFWLVGDGARRRALEARCEREELSAYVRFAGRQPKQAIPAILASSHACLVHLKGCELFGTVIPSKIFETMAVGKPIIMGVNGEARRIVMEAHAGIEIEPDSGQELAHAVTTLADNPQLTARLGHFARQYVADHFDRDELAGEYLQLLQSLAGVETVAEHEPLIHADER
ncbi:MAG: glycosyltransferase family 4 protein [Pirellulaceae bacterium]